MQSCQPLCSGHSLLCSRALHYAATLMITSLRSPSEKQKLFIFDPMHVCGHQIHQQLVALVPFFVSEMSVVPQPISVHILTSWPNVAFDLIPTLMHHFLARWLPFSIISNRHAEARSWKWAPGWWILSRKNTPNPPKISKKSYTEQFQCVVQSMQSAKHVKCGTCFFSIWDFSVAHGRMYDIEQRINSKHHINKGKAIGSMLKMSH